jgi:hypothetical protein
MWGSGIGREGKKTLGKVRDDSLLGYRHAPTIEKTRVRNGVRLRDSGGRSGSGDDPSTSCTSRLVGFFLGSVRGKDDKWIQNKH